MGFVPLTGPATFEPAEPARDGTVTFTDAAGGRRVALPVRAALPVLTRARGGGDGPEPHPSVALLAAAALLALRFVAAGRLAPDPTGRGWRVGPLPADDEERVARLALARAHEGLEADAAEVVVRALLDAVADAVPRAAPGSTPGPQRLATVTHLPHRTADAPAAGQPEQPEQPADFATRLAARLARLRERASPDDRPQLVRLALRVEASEEDLLAGTVRLVPQVHDEADPLHLCDAARLWTEPGPDAEHGFGSRARTHAALAMRAAAQAWPVLDRVLDRPVPDELVLDGAEIGDLLEHGVAALAGRGVDVLWPRSLGRDLTATSVLDRIDGTDPLDHPDPRHPQDRGPRSGPGPFEEPLQDPLLGPDAIFGFRWQVALHGEDLTEEEMDRLAAAAGPLLRLRGGWTVVDPSVARRARRRLERRVPAARALAAALTGTTPVEPGGGVPRDTPVVVGASLLRLRERLVGAATAEPVPSPVGLRAELRDYQRHGLTWLATLTDLGLGGCLADDMGLGKTVTLVALHLHRLEQHRRRVPAGHAADSPGPTLVVCPASLLGNWEAEVRRFAPGVEVRRFHGGSRSADDLAAGHGFVLTTYGTLRRDAAELAAVGWDLVVADEAQHLKNPRSATARTLRTIPARARVALTGTPVENDLTELWAILDWTVPGLLGSRNAFRKVWAAPIESGREPSRAREFADLIGPFLLRRRKSDPGIAPELPAKTETDHLLRLTREQAVLYEAFCRDQMERIERADEETRRGLVLALLTGCKQICNHPAQFLAQSGGRLTGRSEKLDLLEELLGTVVAEGGAALVFTQYVAMARLVERRLGDLGVPHLFLHGGTPVARRESMVASFQAGEVPVLLLSLRAGGTGLNLTRADHVVHLDRWWNPAVEDQATDRAHRIGRTRPVQVHRLVVEGTVEERIAELLARKRSLADAVLGRAEEELTGLTELSDAELRDLVGLR